MELILFIPLFSALFVKVQRHRTVLFCSGAVAFMQGVLLMQLDDLPLQFTGLFISVAGLFACADPIGHWWFARSKDGRAAAIEAIVAREVINMERHLTKEHFDMMIDLYLPSHQKRRMLWDERKLGQRVATRPRRKLLSRLKLPDDLTRTDKIWLVIIAATFIFGTLTTIAVLILVGWWKITGMFG